MQINTHIILIANIFPCKSNTTGATTETAHHPHLGTPEFTPVFQWD